MSTLALIHGNLARLAEQIKRNTLRADRSISTWGLIFLLLLECGFLFLGVGQGMWPIIIAGIAGIIFLVTIFRYPVVWLYSYVIITYFLHRQQDDKVTIFEVLVLGFYCVAPLLWLSWQVFARRKRIVYTLADFMLLTFFILIIINFAVAYFNGVEAIEWFREALLFCLLLYFFPIREYINTTFRLRIFYILCTIILIAFTVTNIESYREAIATNISYLFQLYTGGMPFFQTFFTMGILISFGAMTFIKERNKKIILGIIWSIATGGIITTFQRTFWVFALLGCIFILFFATKKEFISTSKYIIFYILIGLITAGAVLGNKTEAFQKLLKSRFSSTSKLKSDVSFYNRVVESNAALQKVSHYPLSGNGIRKAFGYHNYITLVTTKGYFIHNGYTASIYKYGIPLTVLFYFSLFLYIIYGIRIIPKCRHNLYSRIMSICGVTCLLVIIACNFTHSQFDSRMGNISVGLCIAMLYVAENFSKQDDIMKKNSI